jgi:acetyl-CoA C-acetyltransferase
VKKAFDHAKLKARDVDVAEVHDCFSIAGLLAIEDLGFFKKGEGGKAIESGKIAVDGEIAVNPSGGLKMGHPVGATGVKQMVKISDQLKGIAGKTQRKDAKIGLTHNVGGSGATVTTHLLKVAE